MSRVSARRPWWIRSRARSPRCLTSGRVNDFPLNGRRFSDLALFSPGVTQDPRSLTSATNGDLSFGGIRGFQNTFLVDGGDYNNAFFAQARGRYRAPFVVLDRSGAGVSRLDECLRRRAGTRGRSGGQRRDQVGLESRARHGVLLSCAIVRLERPMHFSPSSRTTGSSSSVEQPAGRIKRNKIFFFAGFDQHIFHVAECRRVSGWQRRRSCRCQRRTRPYPGDYEASDQALVFAAAAQLTSLAGEYPAAQIGNSAYGKLDINLTPRHQLALRLNTTRYWGANNVFLDPASPVTYDFNQRQRAGAWFRPRPARSR